MSDMIALVKLNQQVLNVMKKKIKSEAEFYAKEKKRFAEYMNQRYKTDDAYKERIKEQRKASYYGRKEAKMNASIAVN